MAWGIRFSEFRSFITCREFNQHSSIHGHLLANNIELVSNDQSKSIHTDPMNITKIVIDSDGIFQLIRFAIKARAGKYALHVWAEK